MPQLSVVFPAHNEQDRIGRTLAAYREVCTEHDTELLVALDDCTDATEEVVADHAAQDPRVRIARFPKLGKGGVLITRAFGPNGQHAERVLGLQRAVDQWWRVPVLAGFSPDPTLREYADTLADLYRSAAQLSRAQLVVDSSKDVSHGYVLRAVSRLHPDIDVRVVHLLRDPRAVAFSWLRRKENPGSGRPMDTWPAWRTALEWDVINAGVAGLSLLDVPYLPVGYEQLTGSPRETVQRILTFAGEPAVGVPVDPSGTVALQPSHTAAGNPDRFRSGVTTVTSDAEWRTRMRRRDRILVSVLCARTPARLRQSGPLPSRLQNSRRRIRRFIAV